MRADQKIESCQEPRTPHHSKATADSSQHSLGEGGSCSTTHDITRIRTQLLACLRSAPSRLLSCISSFAILHIDRVSDKDWRSLLRRCERIATNEVEYHCWRAVEDGVLPSGYDASSIAAEAIAEFFEDQEAKALVRTLPALRKHLGRSVRKIVNRLHHRMENRIMRNEPDLARVLTDDGETISITEIVPAPDPTPLDILLEKEDAARFEEFKARIRALLAQERVLLRLFDCFCADICKPKDQARKLKLPVRDIQDLQRRLRRKLAAHGYVPSSWRSRIRANCFHLQPTFHQGLAQAA